MVGCQPRRFNTYKNCTILCNIHLLYPLGKGTLFIWVLKVPKILFYLPSIPWKIMWPPRASKCYPLPLPQVPNSVSIKQLTNSLIELNLLSLLDTGFFPSKPFTSGLTCDLDLQSQPNLVQSRPLYEKVKGQTVQAGSSVSLGKECITQLQSTLK